MTRLLISIILLFATGSRGITNAQTKLMKAATGYANVNGIKMYYEIHGEGKPLVLIYWLMVVVFSCDIHSITLSHNFK